jgi:tellurite resistance protein
MSRSRQITLVCPCGTEFPATLFTAVNVTLEPKLLYQLLAGTLNSAACPNCGRRAESAQPFIYHDMRRGIFAYVHPYEEITDEEREELLATLRRNYALAVEESARLSPPRESKVTGTQPRVRRRTPGEDLARIEPETPPMQVIFGTGALVALVDSLLEPEEKLGRVALTTHSASADERARLLAIAERMAEELECLVDVDDTPQEYTVWVFGPRYRTDTLARALRS